MTDTMNIGPLRYEILRTHKLMDDYGKKRLMGLSEFAACVVQADDGMDPQAERVALFHEGMHEWLSHMGYRDVDEALVCAIAFASLALFDDNQELFGKGGDE